MRRLLRLIALLPTNIADYFQVRRLERFVYRFAMLPYDDFSRFRQALERFRELTQLRTPRSARAVLRLSAHPNLSLDTPWNWKSMFFSAETAVHLIPLLSSSDDHIVLTAVDVLDTHHVRTAGPALVRTIRRLNHSSATREKLLGFLGSIDPKAGATAFTKTELRQFLIHTDPKIVMMAEAALAVSGDRPSLESLFGKLRRFDLADWYVTAVLKGFVDGSHAKECYSIYLSNGKGTGAALGLIEVIIERDPSGVPIEVLRSMTNLPARVEASRTYSHFTDVDRDMSTKSYEECFEERTEVVELENNTKLINLAWAEIRRRDIPSHAAAVPQ